MENHKIKRSYIEKKAYRERTIIFQCFSNTTKALKNLVIIIITTIITLYLTHKYTIFPFSANIAFVDNPILSTTEIVDSQDQILTLPASYMNKNAFIWSIANNSSLSILITKAYVNNIVFTEYKESTNYVEQEDSMGGIGGTINSPSKLAGVIGPTDNKISLKYKEQEYDIANNQLEEYYKIDGHESDVFEFIIEFTDCGIYEFTIILEYSINNKPFVHSVDYQIAIIDKNELFYLP